MFFFFSWEDTRERESVALKRTTPRWTQTNALVSNNPPLWLKKESEFFSEAWTKVRAAMSLSICLYVCLAHRGFICWFVFFSFVCSSCVSNGFKFTVSESSPHFSQTVWFLVSWREKEICWNSYQILYQVIPKLLINKPQHKITSYVARLAVNISKPTCIFQIFSRKTCRSKDREHRSAFQSRTTNQQQPGGTFVCQLLKLVLPLKASRRPSWLGGRCQQPLTLHRSIA